MPNILSWMNSHYVKFGEYLLGIPVALLIGVLGAAISNLNLLSRWLQRLAATIGTVAILLGITVAVTKAVKPRPLSHVPWSAPIITCTVGLLLVVTAWILHRLHKRALQRRLQPVVDAAWKLIETYRHKFGPANFYMLYTPQNRPIIDELLSNVDSRTTGSIVCLTSTGGSGKSATLLELGSRCYSVWLGGRRRHLTIPIYVDLEAFAADSSRPSLRDFILSQLFHDVELIRQLEDLWRDKHPLVRWLFMFDNADRALDRWSTDVDNSTWIVELVEFIGSNPAVFRAVLAGRRTPGIPGSVSVELAPLNIRSCKRVLSDAGASEAQQAVLTSEKSLKYYVGNPGWLQLVGPVLRRGPGVIPDSFYDLMTYVIAGELSSPGASAESKVDKDALRVAGRAATLLNSWSPADGPPLRSTLIERISQLEDLQSATIVAAIEYLVSDKILALYPGPLGAECVEFRHGATQTYFATSLLLADPSELVPHEMFTDSRWMLVTISLLQHGAADLALELMSAAQEIIHDIEPAPPASVLVVNRLLRSMHITEREYAEETKVGSPWSEVAYRVLHILDIGLQRRKELVTEVVRDQTDRLLARAIPQAALHEKVEMLDVQRLAHDDVAAAACVMGLRSNSGPLADAAVLQIASRSELLSMMDVHSRLGFMCAIATEGVDPSATRYASPEAALRLRLASRTGILTAILYGLILGLAGIIEIANDPPAWSGPFVSVVLAAILIASIIGARRSAVIRRQLIVGRAKYVLGFLIIIAILGLVGLIATVLRFLTGNLSALTSLPAVFVELWPFVALLYLAEDPKPSTRTWTFPFNMVALSSWAWLRRRDPTVLQNVSPLSKRHVVIGCLSLLAVVILFGLGKVTNKRWHFPGTAPAMDHALHIWTAWILGIGLAGCALALPIADVWQDNRLIKRFESEINNVTSSNLLDCLERLRTTSATIRMISAVERRVKLAKSPDLAQLLNDFSKVLNWVGRHESKANHGLTDEEWDELPYLATPGLNQWLRAYDKKYRGRLGVLAKKKGKQLADYLLASSRFIDVG